MHPSHVQDKEIPARAQWLVTSFGMQWPFLGARVQVIDAFGQAKAECRSVQVSMGQPGCLPTHCP